MNKKDFKALKVLQRVIVSGHQDGKEFDAETGVIVDSDCFGARLVRFDKWDDGHGADENDWYFHIEDTNGFTITVVEAEAPKKKKGNGKHYWEDVCARDDLWGSTWRLRVPGGWLYRFGANTMATEHTMTFVPVPEVVGYEV